MNKLSAFTTLVTTALILAAADNIWSDEASPNGAAVQTPAPATGAAPGWYPPPPSRGGYTRPWQQPPQWPAYPRGYGQLPPRGPYRAIPAAPAATTTTNSLSAELKQTQEQLAAKNTELDVAHAMLEQLRGTLQRSLEAERALREMVADLTSEQQALQARVTELSATLNTTTATLEQQHQQITNNQELNRMLTTERDRLRSDLASRDEQLAAAHTELTAARQTLQQAQAEAGTAGQQLSAANSQAETFNKELTELKAQLERQQTTLLNADQTRAEEQERLRSDLASRDEQLATAHTELQAARQTLQQAQAAAGTTGQQLNAAQAQAETDNKALTELRTQLERQQATLLNMEQTQATAIAERNGLQENLATCSQELTQARTTLTEVQSVEDALRQAPPAAAGVVVPRTPEGSDKAVKPAASEAPGAGTAAVAALQTAATDTDEDGVADSIDLCPETQQGTAVDSTGCVAGAAITLEGVNFLYNSHELTDKAQHILDGIADVIIQQPELRLEVAGHTDTAGDPAYNQELSMQRAEAVRDYLVAKGVNSRYIGATGYGGQRPIAENTTLEGMRKNRRVELRILQ